MRNAVAAVALAAVIVVGSSLSLGTAGAAQSTASQQQTSANWSGYVVSSSPGKSFSSVSGSWVEPSVNPNAAGDGFAAFWVGLGGAGGQSQSLEQVGTAAQVQNGQTTYSAWYELVPSAQVTLPLTIHPGDKMTGKVTVNGTNVTISLTDDTTGQSVNRTLQMSSPDTSSAEWIAEAPAAGSPGGSLQILPLADFGKVTFTGTSATADGHSGPIGDPAWAATRIDMSSDATSQLASGGGQFSQTGLGGTSSQQATTGASTTGLSDNGSSFSVSASTDSAQSSSVASTAPNPYDYQGDGYSGPGYDYSGSGYGYPGYGYSDPGYGYSGSVYGYPGSANGYSGAYGYAGI